MRKEEREYRILGLCQSNLAENSHPVAVVILYPNGAESASEIFLLRRWQNQPETTEDNGRESLLSLIEDIKQARPGVGTERLFQQLGSLHVGAIRSMAGGRGDQSAVNEQLRQFFENGQVAVSWPESFERA